MNITVNFPKTCVEPLMESKGRTYVTHGSYFLMALLYFFQGGVYIKKSYVQGLFDKSGGSTFEGYFCKFIEYFGNFSTDNTVVAHHQKYLNILLKVFLAHLVFFQKASSFQRQVYRTVNGTKRSIATQCAGPRGPMNSYFDRIQGSKECLISILVTLMYPKYCMLSS